MQERKMQDLEMQEREMQDLEMQERDSVSTIHQESQHRDRLNKGEMVVRPSQKASRRIKKGS